MGQMLIQGILDTLYMTVGATAIAYLFGLPIGVSLVVTAPDGISPHHTYNKVMGFIVNIVRSVPFLILMIALMPYVRIIIGTGIGTSATVAVLVASAVPFVARLVESELREVDKGVIEAAQSMGASNMQIVIKVMLLEARPSLLIGTAVSTITILRYSAMAGVVGGGGLGDIAIKYGLYRYDSKTMWITVVILILLVQLLQSIGNYISKKLDNRI